MAITGCNEPIPSISISEEESFIRIEQKDGDNPLSIELEDELQLSVETSSDLKGRRVNYLTEDGNFIQLSSKGYVKALAIGSATITATIGEYSDTIVINITNQKLNSIFIMADSKELYINDTTNLSSVVRPISFANQLKYTIKSGTSIKLEDNSITALSEGSSTITASIGNVISNELIINVYDKTKARSLTLFATDYTLEAGETATLSSKLTPDLSTADVIYNVQKDGEYTSLSEKVVTALDYAGKGKGTYYQASLGELKSNIIFIEVVEELSQPYYSKLSFSKTTIDLTETSIITYLPYPETSSYNYELHTIDNDNRIADIIGNVIYPKSIGTFTIYSSCKGSNYQRYEIVIVDRSQDPYTNIDSKNFYKYYSPVNSNMDAYYRSLHGYMSGELITPDQAPIIDADRPKLDDKYIRNSSYSIDDSTYVVKDKSGKEIYKIYKDGGYITLEEVAAYIFAFGDVPANYYESPYDGVTPTNSPWGEYLRLNNQYFADDTSTFKYEPSLPNAGSSYYEGLAYFEVDIGTTGTDCDPNYGASLYNDGTRIARGAARIVYTRYKDGSPITNLDDRYVFYTYNHYNDFQEYLNYYNGWGEMFGNITGGGTISSNVDYNPTPYVESSKSKLFA